MLLFVAVEMSLTSMAIPKPNEHTDEASKKLSHSVQRRYILDCNLIALLPLLLPLEIYFILLMHRDNVKIIKIAYEYVARPPDAFFDCLCI